MKTILGKTQGQQYSSAVMDTVEEFNDEGCSFEEGQKSSTGRGEEESSESFQLARRETALLKYSKMMVIFVILLVAVLVASLTYLFVKGQEQKAYESTFQNIAAEVMEYSQLKAKSVVHNMERLGAQITSAAKSSNQEWPFVTIDDFQVKGMMANDDTGAHTVSINPLVFPQNLEAWKSYSIEHQDWMKRAHDYDESAHKELYVLQHFSTEDNHDEDLRWNVTGITSYVWTTTEGEKGDAGHERIPVAEEILYVPVWQRAPASDFYPLVNFDLRSNDGFNAIDGMLAVDHPVITPVVDATYLDTNYEHRFDPEEQAEPHSYLLEPIYDTLTHNRTTVAVLAVFLRWGTFFSDVLPAHENGIFVVLESSCGQSFTYEIFGHDAVFLGEGDKHERELGLEVTFEFSPETQLEKGGEHQFCHYYAHVFPSMQWKEKFYTSRPYAFAGGVLACFAITTLVFLTYDLMVQKRQTKVMSSAQKTNAIVNSLFPANVRDRLLEGIEEQTKEEKQDTGHDHRRKSRTDWSDPSMAFLQNQGSHLFTTKSSCICSEAIFGSKPIADLFPATTIMFADLVGFTAWSSVREPHQVFSLLETVYHGFDKVAKRRRVFKVETVGDCYVAVSGLPMPRKEHASVMCKFATDCLNVMKDLVKQLETALGPDTAELDMRVGLHSGPVTAGVLRGDKGRFQLFGDTMNTASRLESTGCAGKIHISRDTAEILVASGKEKWVTPREDQVFAKGKGNMQTYWMQIIDGSTHTGSNSNLTSTSAESSADPFSKETLAKTKAMVLGPDKNTEMEIAVEKPASNMDQLPDKQQRLVHWNVDILVNILRLIVARRSSLGKIKEMSKQSTKKALKQKGTVLDEVTDVLALPQFDAKIFQNHVDPKSIQIPDKVVQQLTDMVARIAGLYRDNPFHSFEHASHVTMSVTKLLSRIINPNEISTQNGTNDKIASDLHDHTFGITSDPLTQFACILSALIHDADHPGVPNSTLVNEDHPLASKYNNKSVAEQNSVDLAWDIITSADYKELQGCIYRTREEYQRFRSIVVNVVMATDIMDKDLGAQRKARWEKAFAKQDEEEDEETPVAVNRKATIVLEHLMQASDVSHTMQHWVVFRKWNERLFVEMYQAFVEGRSEKDPSEGWYQGELGFFDYYIIPLAKKLETCGVFGVSSHEYLSYAQANRREWEAKGQQLVKDYLWRFHNSDGSGRAHNSSGGSRRAYRAPENVQTVETAPVKKIGEQRTAEGKVDQHVAAPSPAACMMEEVDAVRNTAELGETVLANPREMWC